MLRILALCLAFATLTVWPALAQTASDETSADDLVWHAEDDAELLAAYEAARASLDHFWTVFTSDEVTEAEPTLKVGLPTKDGSLEHIWVDPISRKDGVYTGVLANDPYNLEGDLQLGDTVTFSTKDISDWAYWDGEKLRGHFTTRILMESMSTEEALGINSMLHEQPLP